MLLAIALVCRPSTGKSHAKELQIVSPSSLEQPHSQVGVDLSRITLCPQSPACFLGALGVGKLLSGTGGSGEMCGAELGTCPPFLQHWGCKDGREGPRSSDAFSHRLRPELSWASRVGGEAGGGGSPQGTGA